MFLFECADYEVRTTVVQSAQRLHPAQLQLDLKLLQFDRCFVDL